MNKQHFITNNIQEEYLNTLKECNLFKGLTEAELENALLELKAFIKKYHKGEYIIKEGNIGHDIGILLSGDAEVIQEDFWGYKNIMNYLSKGDAFAEPFALSESAYNISAVALSRCEALYINASKLLLKEKPSREIYVITGNLLAELAEKTLKFNEKITHMSKRNTKDKLMSYLSSMSVSLNSNEFDIPFDRQQLADYLCIDRSAMSKELSKLQKEGILYTTKNHFRLNK